ncbi:MAG: hypothetical protein KDC80_05830 [Saprospiraceae bacterium]|nr:hypothetical protein [Saprospiraceae bacterium]
MKRIINILFISGILFSFYCVPLSGQSQEKEQTYTKNYSPSGIRKLNITHRRGPLLLKNSSDGEIHIELKVRITGKTQEDIDLLFEAIKLDDRNNGNELEVISASQISSWVENHGKATVKLKNGDVAHDIKDLEMIMTIQAPPLENIALKNKYEKIEVASNLTGNLEIDLYSGELIAKNIGGSLTINSKYSTLNFGDFQQGLFDLYECKSTGGTGANLQIKSKYSKVKFDQCAQLNLESYEDTYIIGDIPQSSSISDKYSHFTLANIGDIKLSLYETELEIKSGKKLSAECKYGSVRAESLSILDLAGSYETDFIIGRLDEVIAKNDKYGTFDIDVLNHRFVLTGYESSVDVNTVSKSVSEISVDSKYDRMRFGLPQDLKYSLDAEMKYGNISFDQQLFNKIDRQEKGDELKIKAGIGDSGVKTKIMLRAYETDFTLR